MPRTADDVRTSPVAGDRVRTKIGSYRTACGFDGATVRFTVDRLPGPDGRWMDGDDNIGELPLKGWKKCIATVLHIAEAPDA